MEETDNNENRSPDQDAGGDSRWCAELEASLGYDFSDDGLLRVALTHRSYSHEHKNKDLKDNERLEFLGDAVLDLAVGELLMELFPAANEGQLSRARSALVSEQTLADAAREIGLGRWLLLGRGEEQTGGREKNSLLADAYEAVIAAIHVDGGFEKASEAVRRLFGSRAHKAVGGTRKLDPKSHLQERLQALHQIRPRYCLVGETGPDHEKRFKVALFLWDKELAIGEGLSKKEAEQDAAKRMLKMLDRNPDLLEPLVPGGEP